MFLFFRLNNILNLFDNLQIPVEDEFNEYELMKLIFELWATEEKKDHRRAFTRLNNLRNKSMNTWKKVYCLTA